MSRRNFILIFLAIDFFAVMIWALIVMFNGPRGSILKKMDKLADIVTMEEFKPLDAIKDSQTFLTYFTDPVLIETNYAEFNANHDTESLKTLFLQGWHSSNSIKLTFRNKLADIQDNENLTVTTDALLIANPKQAAQETYEQTLVFHWKKAGGKWRIHKILSNEVSDEF